MASEWHYKHGGQQYGPISTAQLKELAASGGLDPSDLVWKEGLEDWALANRLTGLFPEVAIDASTSPPIQGQQEPVRPPAQNSFSRQLKILSIPQRAWVAWKQLGRSQKRKTTITVIAGTLFLLLYRQVTVQKKSAAAEREDPKSQLLNGHRVTSLPDFSTIDYSKGPGGEPLERFLRYMTLNKNGRLERQNSKPKLPALTVSGTSYKSPEGKDLYHGTLKWKNVVGDETSDKIFTVCPSMTLRGRGESCYFADKLHGPLKLWYENNARWLEVTMVNDKIEGVARVWHKDGSKSIECTFINGEKEGLYEAYWPDGQLRERGMMIHSLFDGLLTGWHSDGSKAFEGNWNRGAEEGVHRKWYQEQYYKHALSEEIHWDHGAKDGMEARYYPAPNDGHNGLAEMYIWNHGNLSRFQSYNADGTRGASFGD